MRDPRDIVLRPIITEKTTASQAEGNQYAFEVARDANKHEIKHAVEALFKVHVLRVQTAQQRGKWRRRSSAASGAGAGLMWASAPIGRRRW